MAAEVEKVLERKSKKFGKQLRLLGSYSRGTLSTSVGPGV